MRTRKTSSSCPIPLQDLGSEVLFWYVAHVHDHSPFSNSASQLLALSYTNRVREPTPSTHDRASCLLHWRQLRTHVLGYQQVAFQEDAKLQALTTHGVPLSCTLPVHRWANERRAVAGLGIRSCMLVCCSRSCPLTSASQKLSNNVLFERCFLDIEQFQTHHFQQFLVIPQLCWAEQFRRCFLQHARTYMPGCQRCHFRPNAPVQGLAWYVACCCVLSDGTWH